MGGTGGGRDAWKRPVMGNIAKRYCDHIILTNEDPYDEDPRKIVDEIRGAIGGVNCEIIMDRREAIREAFKHAKTGDAVIITGKGTDPYIMGAGETKQSGTTRMWRERNLKIDFLIPKHRDRSTF